MNRLDPYKMEYSYYKDDILYNVHIITDKIARSKMMQDKSNIEYCSEIQSSSDSEHDTNLLPLLLDKYTKRVVSKCSAYIESYTCPNNRIVYSMIFPNNWIESFSEELFDAIRDYLVNSILYEYLSIASPKDSVIYMENSTRAEDSIKYCITVRVSGTVRRPINPCV